MRHSSLAFSWDMTCSHWQAPPRDCSVTLNTDFCCIFKLFQRLSHSTLLLHDVLFCFAHHVQSGFGKGLRQPRPESLCPFGELRLVDRIDTGLERVEAIITNDSAQSFFDGLAEGTSEARSRTAQDALIYRDASRSETIADGNRGLD